MRRVLTVLVVLACVMSFVLPAYCACNCTGKGAAPQRPCNDPADGTALEKLGRGIANSISFPFEIPLQMSKVNVSDGPLAGLTWGLLKGLGMAGVRACVGVYEIVTFPFPMPECYAPILKDPEYMFEDQNW